MNTPARRDGTPDRRKRSDQPTRGGATRDARSAARGGTDRGSARGDGGYRGTASRGNAQGGNAYRGNAGGSYRDRQDGGGSYRGGAAQGGSYRDRTEGGSYRGRSDGDGSYRGRNDGGNTQGGNGYRGRSDGPAQGGNGYRGRTDGSAQGASYRPRTENGSAQGNSGRGPGQGGTAQWGTPPNGIPVRRAAQPAPTGKKKNPKPQKQAQSAPLLSNAKPAKRQHVEPAAAEGHVKMPWGEGERLQKVLAKAGVASRRAAEEMIAQGRVEVDGAIVREQGLRIDPQVAVVRVDGTRVMVREELVHIALNKPKGWQSTMSDDLGRPCVGDIVAERVAAGQRLFHVGRLDADTEGLLLLTNDGDLAHRLMHPSFQVSKTYLATVNGEVHKSVGKRLKDGIELEDGPAKVDSFQVLELGEGRSLVKLVLHEGRKHIVRRLLDAVGHPVTRLVRTNIGPVALGDQRPGTLRVLGRAEIGKLYEAVSL
ncbi:pseudouridine synthase [Nocardia brasiliensis]|uniref:pseudouridine synthase n=1 Tax=Nocardia brasiliensis TaxID=37326 RepID=UPI0024547AAD|nr:pseudouridine synthase [Nocardia brasiliensis]